MTDKRYAVVRFGVGSMPSVIVSGTVPLIDRYDQQPSAVVVDRCLTVPAGGDATKVMQELRDISPEINRHINALARPASSRRPAYVPDADAPYLMADVTADPSSMDLTQWDTQYTVRTGANNPTRQHGLWRVMGRLDLMSELRMRMARRQIKVEMPHERIAEHKDARKAIIEVTTKPPKDEQDGLALVETTTQESIAVALALLVHSAYALPPMSGGWGKQDVSSLARGL